MSYRVIVPRVSTPDVTYHEGDVIGSGSLTEDQAVHLLSKGAIEQAGGAVDTGSTSVGEDGYACTFPGCDKTYDSEGWLDRHLASKHGDEETD